MFKIISDELIISSNAQMMHKIRIPSIATLGNWSTGEFIIRESFLGKRPFLMPFLISVVHDLTGYRLENAFIVNTFLVFVFQALSFAYIRSIAGLKSAYLFIILFAFLPVFAQGATSGNASILNLTLLATNLVLAKRYYDNPAKDHLVPLVFGLILLSQARYESLIYVLGFGLLILAGWKRAGKIILSPMIIVSPLFLIMNIIHHRYSMAHKGIYWQSGPNGRDETFSLSYVMENLQSNWEFLFNLGGNHPNSLILSVIGTAGLAICLLSLLGGKDKIAHREYFFLILGLTLLNTLVIFMFNYGTFAVYSTSRLSLPINFFLAIFAAIAFKNKPRELLLGSMLLYAAILYIQTIHYSKMDWIESGWAQALSCLIVITAGLQLTGRKHINRFATLAVILLISYTTMSPKLRNRSYFWKYQTPLIVEKCKEFVNKEGGKDTLFVTRLNYMPLLMTQNGITPADFIQIRKRAVTAMEKDHYRNIYLLITESESLPYPLNMDVEAYNKLVPEFKFEKFQKERILPDLFLSVYRLSPDTE